MVSPWHSVDKPRLGCLSHPWVRRERRQRRWRQWWWEEALGQGTAAGLRREPGLGHRPVPSFPPLDTSSGSVAGWAWEEAIFGRGPEVSSSLIVGDKKEVVICFMVMTSMRLQTPGLQSACHTAGLPLGARGFPWFGGFHLFFKRGCLFSLLLMLWFFFFRLTRRIHNVQPNLPSPILSAACVD